MAIILLLLYYIIKFRQDDWPPTLILAHWLLWPSSPTTWCWTWKSTCRQRAPEYSGTWSWPGDVRWRKSDSIMQAPRSPPNKRLIWKVHGETTTRKGKMVLSNGPRYLDWVARVPFQHGWARDAGVFFSAKCWVVVAVHPLSRDPNWTLQHWQLVLEMGCFVCYCQLHRWSGLYVIPALPRFQFSTGPLTSIMGKLVRKDIIVRPTSKVTGMESYVM